MSFAKFKRRLLVATVARGWGETGRLVLVSRKKFLILQNARPPTHRSIYDVSFVTSPSSEKIYQDPNDFSL